LDSVNLFIFQNHKVVDELLDSVNLFIFQNNKIRSKYHYNNSMV